MGIIASAAFTSLAGACPFRASQAGLRAGGRALPEWGLSPNLRLPRGRRPLFMGRASQHLWERYGHFRLFPLFGQRGSLCVPGRQHTARRGLYPCPFRRRDIHDVCPWFHLRWRLLAIWNCVSAVGELLKHYVSLAENEIVFLHCCYLNSIFISLSMAGFVHSSGTNFQLLKTFGVTTFLRSISFVR